MIVASLRDIERQVAMTSALSSAIAFLRRPETGSLRDGRVEIDGEHIFALVQRYETIAVSEPKFEYHQKYIDVQFILSGEEVIGWTPAESMKITEAYDPEKDIAFGTIEKKAWTPVYLQAGQLALFYPEDGHAPKLAAVTPSPVMKIVVKVMV